MEEGDWRTLYTIPSVAITDRLTRKDAVFADTGANSMFVLESLLKVAETLLSLGNRLQQANADRRRRVSLYFENVSRCLSEIAEALKAGVPPSQACGELREYSVRYDDGSDEKNPIAAVFGKDLAESISGVLYRLVSVRGGAIVSLYRLTLGEELETRAGLSALGYSVYDLTESPEAVLAEGISEIEQAAGKFKALSVIASTLGR